MYCFLYYIHLIHSQIILYLIFYLTIIIYTLIYNFLTDYSLIPETLLLSFILLKREKRVL